MTLPDVEITDTGKVDDKGRPLVMFGSILARRVSNGAIQAVETGKMLRPPDGGAARLQPVRTTEAARALAHTRWHAPRQNAAIEAVREALGNDAIDSIEVADAYMVKALLSEVVLNLEVRGDHRVKAWETLIRHAGMSGVLERQADDTGSGAQQSAGPVDLDKIRQGLAEVENARQQLEQMESVLKALGGGETVTNAPESDL